ncbi:MAG: YARHG domain-containing protein [Defluviitaleaceae bacterium]|nr:YARHG domain-containing protein [Defluviitaleaceae bacterium]
MDKKIFLKITHSFFGAVIAGGLLGFILALPFYDILPGNSDEPVVVYTTELGSVIWPWSVVEYTTTDDPVVEYSVPPEETTPQETTPTPQETTPQEVGVMPNLQSLPSSVSAEYGFIFSYSDRLLLDERDLEMTSTANLRIARNEIFARHGRLFYSQDLQTHFNRLPWYNGHISPANWDESVLNAIERQNIALIQAEEARRQ